MNKSSNTFISSTFWSERIGYVAGLATLKEMKRIKSWEKIKTKGKYLKERLSKIALKHKLSIKFSGLDALIKFEILNLGSFDYNKFITEQMLKKNYLATQNIYVSIAHTKDKIEKYLNLIDSVFKKIAKENRIK